ncbi:MAG: histidine phosphatase family protein [Halobacteriota archaeon]|nr:histidine phosphatase family protein [Halobacteriota archaeon]
MRLIFVRHGQTLWNKERRVQGISDIELSDFGKEQAECLSRCLKNEDIGAMYSSHLKRAKETAEIIGQFHDVEIEIEEGLCELNQGDFEGLAFEELMKKHSEFLRKWAIDPASMVMPNGESLGELQNRACQVIEDIAKNRKNAIIVSHNFTIMTVLCKIQNIDLKNFRRLRVDVASKTVVEFVDGKPALKLLNDTEHLCNLKC